MARKQAKRPTKRVRNLPAKKLSGRRAKEVKGGEIVITKETDTASKKLF